MALVLALGLGAPAWGAVAYVQSGIQVDPNNTSAGTVAVTIAAVGSGGAICGAVMHNTGQTVSGVADDKANIYTVLDQIEPTAPNDVRMTTFYRLNITNAPTVITVTFSANTIYRTLAVAEASGVATSSALDQHTGQGQATPGTGADAVTSGAVTTTTNGQFICGWAAITDSTPGAQFTAGTGYTERQETSSADIDLVLETQVQGAAGSIAATFTQASNHNTVAAIVTLKAATAAPACIIGGGIIRAGCPN